MKHFITSIVLCFLNLLAHADLPGPAYQYDLYSQNQKFFFKSIPYYNFSETDFGKTTVYDTKTKKALYKIENYLPSPSFLNDNGKTLITSKHWLWGHDNFNDQVLIQFFVNGKIGKNYFIKDLGLDHSFLRQTSSHTLWFEKMFIHLDTFYIMTFEGQTISFSANTGELIGKTSSSLLLKRFNKNKLPELKKIYDETIKYPEMYQFPNLKNDSAFRNALIKHFKKTEVGDYIYSKFSISISCVIDRKGNCELFYLRASVNQEEKENEEWEKQVRDWVLRQKFKTDLIPKNCEKWVFEEYFYLK